MVALSYLNPHGYPSRMTACKLIELITGKSAALDRKFKYGTVFVGDNVKDLAEILVGNGCSYSGRDSLISGIAFEYPKCYVFVGPFFYQRLKNHVADKTLARPIGKKTFMRKQTLEGRDKEGDFRLDELEINYLIVFKTSDYYW